MLKFKQKTYDLQNIVVSDFCKDINFTVEEVTEEGVIYTGLTISNELEANKTYCLRLAVNKRPAVSGELYLVYGETGDSSKAAENQIFYYTPLQVVQGEDNVQYIECTFECLISSPAIILRASDLSGNILLEVDAQNSTLKEIKNRFSDLVSGNNMVIKKLIARGTQDTAFLLNDSIYSIPPSQILSTFDNQDVYSFGLFVTQKSSSPNTLILDYWYEEA